MNPSDQLLADVVAETLEQFTFLFVEPEGGEDKPGAAPRGIEASIGFQGGGRQGTLRVAAPLGLCREMAANILGLEDAEITEDVAMDAIKELANVLVGSYTASKLGVDVCCKLDTPTARPAGAARMNELAAMEGALCFRVDEHLFVAVLMPAGGSGA